MSDNPTAEAGQDCGHHDHGLYGHRCPTTAGAGPLAGVAAIEAVLEAAACPTCGCHVSHHHVAGGCSTTFYGAPEDGFPSSSCTCDETFASATAAAIAATLGTTTAETGLRERVEAVQQKYVELAAKDSADPFSPTMHLLDAEEVVTDLRAALTAGAES